MRRERRMHDFECVLEVMRNCQIGLLDLQAYVALQDARTVADEQGLSYREALDIVEIDITEAACDDADCLCQALYDLALEWGVIEKGGE